LLPHSRILHIIESSENGHQKINDTLKADGCIVQTFPFRQTPSILPPDEKPDLILINLSDQQSGSLALCRRYRSIYPQSAICIIHDTISEWEESVALELGADVVIPRPSDSRRILAQVRALLRRSFNNSTPRLHLMKGSRTVKVDNRSISLTDAEYELLNILVQQPGTVVSRETISRHLRGLAYESHERIIDLRIARIRRKLGDDAKEPRFIRTIRGEGYMLMTGDS